MLLSFLLSSAVQATAPAVPKAPEPVCIRAGDLPTDFARWNDATVPMLGVGAPHLVTARNAASVTWLVPPARPGNGAVVQFRVFKAGLYRIGLSNGAWIDILSGKKAVASVAHGHGPACTGLRKIVDFRLTRGPYTLQLSSMREATTKVMIVAK